MSHPPPNLHRRHWRLNPAVDFLNHGSFGAMPNVVFESQRHWIEQLERDPIEFLAPERTLLPKLDQVRDLIAELVRADAADIAFVRNATEGVNAVLRSFPFSAGDEVLITSHGYNACNNAVRYSAEKADACVQVAELPFPIHSESQVIESIESRLTRRTRLILVDHVTSPTGLVLPIREIVELAHRRNVRVMIDGAHAPGMVEVDLQKLDADYYTANHHKWLCGPKTSGFLHVRRDLQDEVRPAIISHGANTSNYGPSRFLGEFNWVGTYDPTPILAMPTAIEFLNSLIDGGLPALMNDNRSLVLAGRRRILDALDLAEPAPDGMIGSLASVPIAWLSKCSRAELNTIQQRIYKEHRIEVPVFSLGNLLPCVRISAQAYNSIDQYERLADALRTVIGRSPLRRSTLGGN